MSTLAPEQPKIRDEGTGLTDMSHFEAQFHDGGNDGGDGPNDGGGEGGSGEPKDPHLWKKLAFGTYMMSVIGGASYIVNTESPSYKTITSVKGGPCITEKKWDTGLTSGEAAVIFAPGLVVAALAAAVVKWAQRA